MKVHTAPNWAEHKLEVAPKPPAKDVTLDCSVKQENDVLHVSFTLKSDTKELIFVFDHGALPMDPDALYADQGHFVNVIIGVPDFPPNVAAAWKYHPKTSPLTKPATLLLRGPDFFRG